MTVRKLWLGGLAAVLAAVLTMAVPAGAQETGQGDPPLLAEPSDRPASATRAPRYFIEFRSRNALSYGHSFVVFGRTGGRLTARNVAGLHPKGSSPVVYMLGHVLPVPSETGVSDGDLELQYVTARYRVALSQRDYAALVPKIRALQANSPAWNAVAYNCNAFVGDIARLVGLRSPPPWMLPADFINTMRALNEPAANAMARHTRKKR
jgi:hypothetical protein